MPRHEIKKVVGSVHVEYTRHDPFLFMAPPEHVHHTSPTPHLHNDDDNGDDHNAGVDKKCWLVI